jgi:hypothetical protein
MTKYERLHYGRLSHLGCIVCLIKGHGYSQPEIHHLRTGMGIGMRNDYMNAIPLCPAHHRTGGHGVAYHSGRLAFEKMIGMSESELLNKTLNLLKGEQ